MAQKHTDQDETMIKAVVLLSLGAFIFFFFVSLSGFGSLTQLYQGSQSQQPQVLGVSNLPVPEVANVEVMLNNSNLGEGILELDIPKALAVSGAEFHFELTDSLDIRGVVCSSQFVCVETLEDNVYHLSLFRLPDLADVPLNGKVKVATILYARDTFGEMVVNGDTTERSMVVELGTDEDHLSPNVVYLAVGQNPY